MLGPPNQSSLGLPETFVAFSHARQPSNSFKSTFLEPSRAEKSISRENVEKQVWRHQTKCAERHGEFEFDPRSTWRADPEKQCVYAFELKKPEK